MSQNQVRTAVFDLTRLPRRAAWWHPFPAIGGTSRTPRSRVVRAPARTQQTVHVKEGTIGIRRATIDDLDGLQAIDVKAAAGDAERISAIRAYVSDGFVGSNLIRPTSMATRCCYLGISSVETSWNCSWCHRLLGGRGSRRGCCEHS